MNVLVDGKLTIGKHVTSSSREMILHLSDSEKHLEYCVQFWAPQHERQIGILEWVQKGMWTPLTENLLYKDRLIKVGSFSREKAQGHPWKYKGTVKGQKAQTEI